MSSTAIILASTSASRHAMLKAAGVGFTVVAPEVDEDAITKSLKAKGSEPASVAETLAGTKAVTVSSNHPGALVIGADQVLVCGDEMIAKAENEAQARRTLLTLRGTDHTLISAAVLARDGAPIWTGREAASLQMRNFSEAFLDQYLATELPGILGSVGCYRIEERGAQLFEWIVGDQFCVRGLPLVKLLGALREFGALPV